MKQNTRLRMFPLAVGDSTNQSSAEEENVRGERAFLKSLGRQLKVLRQKKGFTQETLAKLADVGEKHLGAVERGETNPTILLLRKLAKALEVEPSELFLFSVVDKDCHTCLRIELLHLLKDWQEKELRKVVRIFKIVEE